MKIEKCCKKYRVVAEYPSEWYFTKTQFDYVIEKTAKVEMCGSGMGFGVRDVDFCLKTKRGALGVYSRLAKLRGVKVTAYELTKDDLDEKVIKRKGK